MKTHLPIPRLPLLLLLPLVAACGRVEPAAPPPAPRQSYADFIRRIAPALDPSRLDVAPAGLASSVDPTGKNDDFNNFAGQEGGRWAVLADLPGPGYVSRFWTTGGKTAEQRLRFYFDDEAEPRIDATVEQLRGGRVPPFGPPLARYEQSCWWSYVPIPFEKRLRILAETENFTREGWPRLFYQVNHTRFPTNAMAPASWPRNFTEHDLAALADFAAAWERPAGAAAPGTNAVQSFRVDLPAGATGEVCRIAGPAVMTAVEFDLGEEKSGAAEAVVAQLRWDGRSEPSVDLSLAALAGRLWGAPAHASAFYASTGGVLAVRCPMPFRESAALRLINTGTNAVALSVRMTTSPLAAWDDARGYFHAQWRRSGPQDKGRPHAILAARGAGRYAGVALAVASADPSWWVLEGDESVRVDGESTPGWRGTGLEDYFNGAWYYKNNLARPLHGLAFKRPFVTVQYRLHLNDARVFRSDVAVEIERGPDHVSAAWFESVAYYYLREPAAAGGDGNAAGGAPPADPFEADTIMLTLCNYERFGDYAGALRAIDRAIARFPKSPAVPVLELRRIATRERILGFAAVKAEYEAFLKRTEDGAAQAYARMLLWFHEDPSHALLSVLCGNPARVFIDQTPVAEVANPQVFAVFPIQLSPGAHVLTIQAQRAQYPEWVQACLRTHSGMVATGPDWPFQFDPPEACRTLGFATKDWPVVGDNIREGPPPVPYVATTPHPFVDMQSQAAGIWLSVKWPEGRQSVVFRKEFTGP